MSSGFQPYKLPVIGGLGESLGLWDNPDAQANEEQFGRTADAYQAYRPEQMAAREHMLNQAMAMFNPLQNFLFGDKAGFTASHGQEDAPPEDFLLAPPSGMAGAPTPGQAPPPSMEPGELGRGMTSGGIGNSKILPWNW